MHIQLSIRVLVLFFYENQCVHFKSKLKDAIHRIPQDNISAGQHAYINNLVNFAFVGSEQFFLQGLKFTDIDCMIQHITAH